MAGAANPTGGIAAFGVMSPLCLWEIGHWHGLHGDFRTAFRRLRRDTTFDGLTIRYQPSAACRATSRRTSAASTSSRSD
ncbi:MAG: hypothetical protein U0521_01630 [Anaerolineae bacterium]